MFKKKTIWLYVDGKKKGDVVKMALKENMMVSDMKKKLTSEYDGHIVEFKVK